jgi:serine/threonine protein kinase
MAKVEQHKQEIHVLSSSHVASIVALQKRESQPEEPYRERMRGWDAVPRPALDASKLELMGTLEGYTHVWKGKYDGRTVVVKEFGPDEEYLRNGLIECRAYETLCCPTLLGYVGHCEMHDKKGKLLRMVLEYAPYGSLKNVCKSAASEGERTAEGMDVSLRQRVQWSQHIVQAVQYLHNCHVMHRDIKPDNVMLRADLTAVLADLEHSRRLGSELSGASSELGTWGFMAPEMESKQGHYTYATDVYSLGITIVSIWVGSNCPSRDECLSQLTKLDKVIPHHSSRLGLLHDIAERCTRPEPRQSPPAQILCGWFDRLLREWDMLEQLNLHRDPIGHTVELFAGESKASRPS